MLPSAYHSFMINIDNPTEKAWIWSPDPCLSHTERKEQSSK